MLEKIRNNSIIKYTLLLVFLLVCSRLGDTFVAFTALFIFLYFGFVVIRCIYRSIRYRSFSYIWDAGKSIIKLFVIIFIMAMISPDMKNTKPQNNNMTTNSINNKSNNSTDNKMVAQKEKPIVSKEEPKVEVVEQSRTSKRISNRSGMPPKAANIIEEIIEKCGFSSWDIRREADLDGYKDNPENKAYIIDENDLKRIIVYATDDKVVAVRFEGYNIYSDGKQNYTKKDFYLSTEEFTKLQFYCQDTVTSYLGTPDTDFPSYYGWKAHKSPKKITMSSYVDFKNPYGTKLRRNFEFEFAPDGSKATSFVIANIKVF